MAIDFSKPIFLILIPLCLLFIWYTVKDNTGFKSRFIASIRSIICLLLIFAISGINIKTYTDTTTTIFAADLSDSVGTGANTAEQFIKEAVKHKGDKDYAGVVAFGGDTGVEVSPAKEVVLDGFSAYVNKEDTNIDKALKTASSFINDDTEKRIILLSDGIETEGEAIKNALSLFNSGVIVDAVVLGNDVTSDVQISNILTPNYMNKNTQYDIEVTIDSVSQTDGKLKIYKGKALAIEENVSLRRGENKFLFSDISSEGGGIIYRAEIESDSDTIYKNNKGYSYTYVEDTPGVLIVENANNSGRELKKLLESAKVRTEVIKDSQVPKSVEELNIWDAVILADVSAENLDSDFLNALESFVKTTGGGLITTGGENSYALGAYKGTILEEILPVTSDLKTEGEKPDLGMVMVIDRSGSMTDSSYGLSNMEMAKEAAIRAVEVMEPEDSVGVIGFDDIPTWYAEIQKVGTNVESIAEKIGTMQAGGGTSILPALEEAYAVLSKTDSKTKHIILLTDGQAEQHGYDMLINSMQESGITLSTVAVGNGADVNLLQKLAEGGNGRYYYTNAFTDLPQIFTKETTLAGKEYINNRSFYPTAGDNSSILNGVEEVAELKGYIGTTAKPRADVVLKSDKEEPVLATWQYGLGRTAAWTSDADGRWTSQWINSDSGVTVIKNLVSWVMRSNVSDQVTFSAKKEGGMAVVTAKMPYNGQIESVNAVIVGVDNKEVNLEMKAVSPGIYEGKAEEISEGGYIISLREQMKDGSEEVERGGFNITYPKEYDIRTFNGGREFLEKLTAKTGGKILENPEDAFSKKTKTTYKSLELFTPFVIAAILLLLLEIAFRRFAFLSEKAEKFFRKISSQKQKSDKQKKDVKQTKEFKETLPAKIIKEEGLEKKVTTADLLVKKKKKRS